MNVGWVFLAADSVEAVVAAKSPHSKIFFMLFWVLKYAPQFFDHRWNDHQTNKLYSAIILAKNIPEEKRSKYDWGTVQYSVHYTALHNTLRSTAPILACGQTDERVVGCFATKKLTTMTPVANIFFYMTTVPTW